MRTAFYRRRQVIALSLLVGVLALGIVGRSVARAMRLKFPEGRTDK